MNQADMQCLSSYQAYIEGIQQTGHSMDQDNVFSIYSWWACFILISLSQRSTTLYI